MLLYQSHSSEVWSLNKHLYNRVLSVLHKTTSPTSNMLPQPPLMSTTAMSVALGKDFARAAINACSPELGAHKSGDDVNKDLLQGN